MWGGIMKQTGMYQSIGRYEFAQAFKDYGRDKAWTREGLNILFDYLDEWEEFELDVVAIDCDYCEMNVHDIADDYSIETNGPDYFQRVCEYLHDNTTLVGITESDSIVFCSAF
jgi:hypothetical protein